MQEYEKQAQQFLDDTGATVSAKLVGATDSTPWDGEHKHYKYSVTLERSGGRYEFDFYESRRHAEIMDALEKLRQIRHARETPKRLIEEIRAATGVRISAYMDKATYEKARDALAPSAYIILASLSLLYEDTLEDFCDAYGYDHDSIKARDVYHTMLEQDRRLRRMFTSDELEKLETIQ